MRRASGVSLILIGAIALYALGRWGGAGDLLPLLGPHTGRSVLALLAGLIGLLLGMFLLVPASPPFEEAPARKKWTPGPVLTVANGLLILACASAAGVGAARGWEPEAIAAWTGMAMAEVALGLILVAVTLRSGPLRPAGLLSMGMVLAGFFWSVSILTFGPLGA